MRRILFIIGCCIIAVVAIIGCQDKGNPIVTNPSLASSESVGKILKVKIKTNGGPERQFTVAPTEWNEAISVEQGKFYKMPKAQKASFIAKVADNKSRSANGIKIKSSSSQNTPQLAGYDHQYGDGLSARTVVSVYSWGTIGDCITSVYDYYYGTKIHVHDFETENDFYYYYFEDEFSEWSEVETVFESDDTEMCCDAAITRQNFWYEVVDSIWVEVDIYDGSTGEDVTDTFTGPGIPGWLQDHWQVDTTRTLYPGNSFSAYHCESY